MNATLPERVKGVCCPPSITVPPAKVDASVEVLKALADPTRLQMVAVLKRSTRPVCICDFTAAFELSQPTISHHMGKLRDAGLVVTMGCGDECPYIAGKTYIDWELTDPADQPLAQVRRIRDDIRARVEGLARDLSD